MATFVFLHAHPDDEAIGSGGTMAVPAAAGHRAVVLPATRGECGIVPAQPANADGLGEMRAAQARRSAESLGAARPAFLGYRDSGEQPGDPAPGSFAAADPDEAAALSGSGLLRSAPMTRPGPTTAGGQLPAALR